MHSLEVRKKNEKMKLFSHANQNRVSNCRSNICTLRYRFWNTRTFNNLQVQEEKKKALNKEKKIIKYKYTSYVKVGNAFQTRHAISSLCLKTSIFFSFSVFSRVVVVSFGLFQKMSTRVWLEDCWWSSEATLENASLSSTSLLFWGDMKE